MIEDLSRAPWGTAPGIPTTTGLTVMSLQGGRVCSDYLGEMREGEIENELVL